MRSSTPGRWARRIGVPAAAMVAVALVGAPAFAATSTPDHPTPPGCVVIGQPGKGTVTLPAPGKPGKGCVICIIKKHPGDGGERGATAAAGGEAGTTTAGKPGQCPVCPPPPGKPGTTGSGEGTGTVTLPGTGTGAPGKGCTICIVIKPGEPGGPTTKPAPGAGKPVPGKPVPGKPVPGKPVPGKPVKCEPLPGKK